MSEGIIDKDQGVRPTGIIKSFPGSGLQLTQEASSGWYSDAGSAQKDPEIIASGSWMFIAKHYSTASLPPSFIVLQSGA